MNFYLATDEVDSLYNVASILEVFQDSIISKIYQIELSKRENALNIMELDDELAREMQIEEDEKRKQAIPDSNRGCY